MRYENDAILLERARHYAAAQQLKEDVLHLKERWNRYNFPVQELLRLMLTQHGLQAATLATDALDRQFYTRSTPGVAVSTQQGVLPTMCKKYRGMREGILLHERSLDASLF